MERGRTRNLARVIGRMLVLIPHHETTLRAELQALAGIASGGSAEDQAYAWHEASYLILSAVGGFAGTATHPLPGWLVLATRIFRGYDVLPSDFEGEPDPPQAGSWRDRPPLL